MIDLRTPQALIAQHYMENKGVRLMPYDMEQLEDEDVWYFYYSIPEGVVELEVSWNAAHEDWEVVVTQAPGKQTAI